jgi:hypothetical protein
MPNPKNNFLEIPINKGSQPNWITRLGGAENKGIYGNFNMFVGESGFCYSTPRLNPIAPNSPLLNIRAIWYTPFDGGSYIVVTSNTVFRVFTTGVYNIISNIVFSNLAVQMDENIQNQITLVDGLSAYVIDQRNATFVKLNQTANGFNLTAPISVVVINTFTIVLDGATNSWIVSSPNNALVYPPLTTVPTIESQLTQAISLETLDNNLYIFGTTGIERWEPNLNTNTYAFAFIRDNNFRVDFGAISTNCVIRGSAGSNSRIYFLSSQYVPMALTTSGLQRLPEKGNQTGIARILSEYPDVDLGLGSFYSWSGNYFYQLTFPQTGIAWVYAQNSETWSQSDDLIVSASPATEIVATQDGLFSLSFNRIAKHRRFQSPRITNYKGRAPFRNLLQGAEAKIVQGELTNDPQSLEMTVSIDSESWLNTIARPLGPTGQRNNVVTWNMNLAAYEFTFRLDYFGDLDLTLESFNATIV